jgi:hypothetical protein
MASLGWKGLASRTKQGTQQQQHDNTKVTKLFEFGLFNDTIVETIFGVE